MNEPQAYQASPEEARLSLVIAAARRISLAADALKAIEGMDLDADQLTAEWDHAYSELYRANEELKHALPKQPEPEKR